VVHVARKRAHALVLRVVQLVLQLHCAELVHKLTDELWVLAAHRVAHEAEDEAHVDVDSYVVLGLAPGDGGVEDDGLLRHEVRDAEEVPRHNRRFPAPRGPPRLRVAGRERDLLPCQLVEDVANEVLVRAAFRHEGIAARWDRDERQNAARRDRDCAVGKSTEMIMTTEGGEQTSSVEHKRGGGGRGGGRRRGMRRKGRECAGRTL
jgi:hypothetical protein